MSLRRHKIALTLSLLICFGGFAAVQIAGVSPRLGLDLAGGTSVIMRAQGPGANHQDVLEKTVSIIRQRIDSLGVAEPEVTVEGENNILVQLPGVKNTSKALSIIGRTAQLTFRQVEAIYPPGARSSATPSAGAKTKKKATPTPSPSVPPITEDTTSAVNEETVVYPVASSTVGPSGTTYKLAPAVLTGDVI